eukprot:8818396-Pyramimonas_sp.AAC.1
MRAPTKSDIRKVVARARHSAPGIDGLPYAAWASADVCLDVLCNSLDWLLSGQLLYDSASVTIQAFLPKGTDQHDESGGGCSRSADRVRVLGLRSADVKISTAAINRSMRPLVDSVVPCAQRGFVVGRNFGYHILELDGLGGVAASHPLASSRLPLLVSFDFGQAFPSISQQFIYE